MSTPSVLALLLEENNWGQFQPLIDQLTQWEHYPVFREKLNNLNRAALYHSPIHGIGHIERTMLHGAFCAMMDELNETDTRLLLEACSYHDVGRINDWLDYEHGYRSSLRLGSLTERTGEELTMLKAAVEAHSRKDDLLEPTLRSYHPSDYPRTLLLAQLLKDADGLDRVRIHDLNVRYLRRPHSAKRAVFAEYLYQVYQTKHKKLTGKS